MSLGVRYNTNSYSPFAIDPYITYCPCYILLLIPILYIADLFLSLDFEFAYYYCLVAP